MLLIRFSFCVWKKRVPQLPGSHLFCILGVCMPAPFSKQCTSSPPTTPKKPAVLGPGLECFHQWVLISSAVYQQTGGFSRGDPFSHIVMGYLHQICKICRENRVTQDMLIGGVGIPAPSPMWGAQHQMMRRGILFHSLGVCVVSREGGDQNAADSSFDFMASQVCGEWILDTSPGPSPLYHLTWQSLGLPSLLRCT